MVHSMRSERNTVSTAFANFLDLAATVTMSTMAIPLGGCI